MVSYLFMCICGHVLYCNQRKRLNKSKAYRLFIDLMQVNLSKILKLYIYPISIKGPPGSTKDK